MKKKQTPEEDIETGIPACSKATRERPVAIIPGMRNGSGLPEDMNIS